MRRRVEWSDGASGVRVEYINPIRGVVFAVCCASAKEKEATIKALVSETRIFPFILSIPTYRVTLPQLFEDRIANGSV